MPDRVPPNVVVFCTDQQRWDTTGLHGNPMGLTPNLDRLARANTHVAHSLTCQPVCGPAREVREAEPEIEPAPERRCGQRRISADAARQQSRAGYETQRH